MTTQAKTQLSAFRFATIAEDSDECMGDIRAGQATLAYKMQGLPQVLINTSPNPPHPAPPVPEPATPANNDPVIQLLNNGWKITDSVMAGGVSTMQPAGLGMGPAYWDNPPPQPPPPPSSIFESLKLQFVFPLFCICAENGNCKVKRYSLEVTYDGTSHPKVGVKVSNEGNCPDYLTLAPNTDLVLPRSGKSLKNNNQVTYTFETGVTCDCDPATDNSNPMPPAETEVKKCPLKIVVEYYYSTTLP
ncbi:MAG: hypothetical protein AAF402_00745 [Pseudomonadota bacterium]